MEITEFPIVNVEKVVNYYNRSGLYLDLLAKCNSQEFRYIDGAGKGYFLTTSDISSENVTFTVGSRTVSLKVINKLCLDIDANNGTKLYIYVTAEPKYKLYDYIVTSNYNLPSDTPLSITEVIQDFLPEGYTLSFNPIDITSYNIQLNGMSCFEALDHLCSIYGWVWTLTGITETTVSIWTINHFSTNQPVSGVSLPKLTTPISDISVIFSYSSGNSKYLYQSSTTNPGVSIQVHDPYLYFDGTNASSMNTRGALIQSNLNNILKSLQLVQKNHYEAPSLATNSPISLSEVYGDWGEGPRSIYKWIDYPYYKDTNVSSTSSSEWIRFTLNEDIDSETAGLVTVVDSLSSTIAIGHTVSVYNGTPNDCLTGAIGEAILADGVWVAILIGLPVQFIAATATSHSHQWVGSSGTPTTTMPSEVSPLTITTPVALTPWPHDHDVTIEVLNPFKFFWRAGATLLLMRSPRFGGCYEVVHATSGPVRAKFKLTEDVGTGNLVETVEGITILPIAEAGIMPAFPISLIDRYCLAHNAKIDDTGTADLIIGDGTWEISECSHVATYLMGTISSTFSGTPANIVVNQVYGLNGRSPTASGSTTLNVKNRFNWESGTAAGKLYFAWDQILGEYFAIQMTCP